MRFAAFIMTYERAEILPDTIDKILSQSFPPQEILIVDNSSSNETHELWENLGNDLVTYHKMGYNAGPAGAAHYGLKTLAEKGYDWIFWGDDDDPPKNDNEFKKLLEFSRNKEKVGIVGEVGGMFKKNRARTVGFTNKELEEVVEADYVTGGKLMIVNAEVIKNGVLPTKKLFFGFEELDFCLKVKEAGYRIIFNGDVVKENRFKKGNTKANYKWKGKSFGNTNNVWRQYYSTRNMLYILKEHKIYTGYLFLLIKSLVKIPFSFRYGKKYGFNILNVYVKAIVHHFKGNYGFYNIKDNLK